MLKNVFVISHRRSGTHLLIDAILNNFKGFSKPFLNIDLLNSRYNNSISLHQFTGQLASGPRVIKSHMHADIENFFEGAKDTAGCAKNLIDSSKVIYVYRDGRDVLMSLYFYIRSFNPEIKKVSFSDFIKMDNDSDSNTYAGHFDRVEYWKYHVSGWRNKKDVLFISFEDIVNDYELVVKKIADFLEVEMPRRIKKVLRENNKHSNRCLNFIYQCYRKFFRRISYTSVNFRRGSIGGDRQLYSEASLEYFDSKAGDIMKELGYS